MKKIMTIICIFLVNITVVTAKDLNFDLYSENVVLYNFNTSSIIYEKNLNEKTQIASLTKLFTVYFSILNIKDINESVILTTDVFEGLNELGASVAGFKVGDSVTYLDLLYATMLPSGADATRALSINLFDSEKEFAKQMTNYMKETIGLKNTNFVNSSGLHDNNHYSTVGDVLKFMVIALENDLFRTLYEARTYTTTNGLSLKSTYQSAKEVYNLGLNKYILGTKTGFTNQSGVCLASMAEYNNTTYILITTKAESIGYANIKHYADAKEVYDYMFENFAYETIIDSNEAIANIPIIYSRDKEYKITLDGGYNNLKDLNSEYKAEFNGIDTINPLKVKKGDSLGTISIYEDEQLIYSKEVFLTSIKFSLIYFLLGNMHITLLILICIVTILYFLKKGKRRKHARRKVYKTKRQSL